MTRMILLSAAMLACLPMIAFGQARVATTNPEVLCCGQSSTADDSPSTQQLRLETQQTLQALLMLKTGATRLRGGDYLIVENDEGYEFRALVSRQGVVDGWYLADMNGMPVALINANGSGAQSGGGYRCFVIYGQAVSACAYLEKMGRHNRYQACIDGAWDSLMACLSGGQAGGVIIR
jgi:hypothetical protein